MYRGVGWTFHNEAAFGLVEEAVIPLPEPSASDEPYEELFAQVQRDHPGKTLRLVKGIDSGFAEAAIMRDSEDLAVNAWLHRNDPKLMAYVV